jgi:hypothetical protein
MRSLSDRFSESLDFFMRAQVQRELEFQMRERFGATDTSQFLREGPVRYAEILTAVRERLLATRPERQEP